MIYIYIYIYIYYIYIIYVYINFFILNFCENKKPLYLFSPQTIELRRMYLCCIQIFVKFIEKDSFA